jgi:hypothetical protein
MTMFEGTFECTNCGEEFPVALATKLSRTDNSAGEYGAERVFHSPECALEWERQTRVRGRRAIGSGSSINAATKRG